MKKQIKIKAEVLFGTQVREYVYQLDVDGHPNVFESHTDDEILKIWSQFLLSRDGYFMHDYHTGDTIVINQGMLRNTLFTLELVDSGELD